MKRMKKKVVAMVTLAMFVMTLLPMAAFAAVPNSDINTAKSEIKLADNQPEVVDVNEAIGFDVIVRGNDGVQADPDNTLVVWAEKEGTERAVVSNVTFKGGKVGYLENGTAVYTNTDGNIFESVAFPTGGEYTLHAGVLNEQIDLSKVTPKNISKSDITEFDNAVKVTVTDKTQDKINFENVTGNVDHDNNIATVSKSTLEADGFKFNGVATYTITGTIFNDADPAVPMENVKVTLSSNKDALVLEDDVVTTDGAGKFDIEFSMTEETNASITVETSELKYTIKINAADSAAEYITTVKEDGYVISSKDKDYYQEKPDFSDAVQFEITDENGNVLEGQSVLANDNGSYDVGEEPAAVATAPDHAKNIKIDKPTGATVTANDLVLAWDPDVDAYTVKVVSDKKKGTNFLKEGEYTVTVALLSGENATATFNVAKFGDVEDIVLDTYAKKADAAKGDVDRFKVEDEIALGDKLKVEAKFVDENGIKVDANKVNIGVEGQAVKGEIKEDTSWYALKDDRLENAPLIGSVIKIVAVSEDEKTIVEKELTVVDAYNTYKLAFDKTEGDINFDNTVNVSVVDADDNVAKKVNGTVTAYVAKQSNENAKVTVDTTGVQAKKGKFEIKVYSNEVTTADIVVAVKADNGAIYAGTLSYTFGEEDIPAGTSVVMTLGSTEMIINNEVVDMKDAAPFAQNNRTYVPFRALGEALGAQVEYDKDAKTVTYELGSTKIVMTLDSKTYTVNGAKKTMDVAPFAKDNRTYVPVRFVGEGLGFTVTGLTNANGQYVAVAFTK